MIVTKIAMGAAAVLLTASQAFALGAGGPAAMAHSGDRFAMPGSRPAADSLHRRRGPCTANPDATRRIRCRRDEALRRN